MAVRAVRAERLQLGHGSHGSHGSHHAAAAALSKMSPPLSVGSVGLGGSAASPSRMGTRALRPLNTVCAAKRKSAVELLQESKAFYVKSDCVLDRQQRLQRPSSSPPCSPCSPCPCPMPLGSLMTMTVPPPSALLSPPPSPSPLSSPCAPCVEPMPPAPPGFQQESSPSPIGTPSSSVPTTPRSLLLPKSPRLSGGSACSGLSGTTWGQRRAASQQLQSDRLQNKLRRLLNADSKENVCHGDSDDPGAGAAERTPRAYGRSNSQTHHSYSSRTWSNQTSASLHKSLPDLHSSPTATPTTHHPAVRWDNASNASNRGTGSHSHSHASTRSSTSSQSGDGYADYVHRRSGSHRGSRSLHYSGDSMSVVSSGGRTHQSHRSQPAASAAPAAPASGSGSGREAYGELRRGGSSGSSSGARTHASQPEGRSRANTVSEALIRQSSGGSSWSSRYRSRPSSQYYNVRSASHASTEELEASRGNRGSRGSLGSKGSSHKSENENYTPPPHCSRVAELCWNFEPRRPILRSKSDISHRYSGSVNVPLSPPLQDPAQLEKFFEQLGLDNSEFRYVSRTRSDSSDSPVFFSSVSSVDSNNGGWSAPWTPHGSGLATSTAGTPGGMMGSGHSGKIIEQPSIVERNARIIKWLCNCRKAQKEMFQVLGNGNVS